MAIIAFIALLECRPVPGSMTRALFISFNQLIHYSVCESETKSGSK
jgi:hypothetical protein